jgi:hypothetical protein
VDFDGVPPFLGLEKYWCKIIIHKKPASGKNKNIFKK